LLLLPLVPLVLLLALHRTVKAADAAPPCPLAAHAVKSDAAERPLLTAAEPEVDRARARAVAAAVVAPPPCRWGAAAATRT